jgi:hypothetical protein
MAGETKPAADGNAAMFICIKDGSGRDIVDAIEVAIPRVLPLKIAKLYLPTVALKAVKDKLPDALKALGFK